MDGLGTDMISRLTNYVITRKYRQGAQIFRIMKCTKILDCNEPELFDLVSMIASNNEGNFSKLCSN